MSQPLKKIELSTIVFEISSESSTPESNSPTSIDIHPFQTPTKSKQHLSLASPAKSFSSTASACRICHEGDTIGPLMSPCECKGTIALVHDCCLEKWLTTSNKSQCEVCKFAFKVKKTPRTPSEWLSSEYGIRNFYIDLICLFLCVPGGVTVSCLCSWAAVLYLRQGRLEGLGLFLITAMIIVCFAVWIYFTIRFHLRNFQNWRDSNPDIQLIPSRLRISNRSRASNRSLTL